MIVRIFLCFFIFTFGRDSYGVAFFSRVTLDTGETLQGEIIEIYEDRWFYEQASEGVQKYLLLFEMLGDRPQFHLKALDTVKKVEMVGQGPSLYFKLLRSRGIELKRDLVKGQDVLTGPEGHHKFERMFGNFAWDIGLLNINGSQFQNKGQNLEDYYVFSKQVVSPVGGTVIGVVSDRPDNPPDPGFSVSLAGKESNYLTIQIDQDFYLSVVHFKQDSIPLKVGDRVSQGDVLGQVGNSGVSYIPHLHYTLYIYSKDLNRFISVPGTVRGHSNHVEIDKINKLKETIKYQTIQKFCGFLQ